MAGEKPCGAPSGNILKGVVCCLLFDYGFIITAVCVEIMKER